MKLFLIAATLSVALAGITPVAAQHHVVTKRTVVHHGPGGVHRRRVCRVETRHHHRVRTCRTVHTR